MEAVLWATPKRAADALAKVVSSEPIQGIFHTVDTVTPVQDGERVLVFLGVEDWNFSLDDLHDWVLGGGSHQGDGGSSS